MIKHHLVRHRGYTSLVTEEEGIFVLKILGITDSISGEIDDRASAAAGMVEMVDDYLETCAETKKEPDLPPTEHLVSLLVRADAADRGDGLIDVTGMSDEEFIALLRRPAPTALTLTAFVPGEAMVTQIEFQKEAEPEVRWISGLPDSFKGGYRLPDAPLKALLAHVGLEEGDGWEWFLEVTQTR